MSMIVTFLPGNLLALTVSRSLAFLLILVFSLLSRHLLTILLSGVAGHLFVFGSTIFSVLRITFLSRNVLTVLLRYLVAHLVGDLVTYLLRFAKAFLLRDNGSHSLLNIMTFVNRNWAADRLVGH